MQSLPHALQLAQDFPPCPEPLPLLPPLRPTHDGQPLHDVHPQQVGSFGRFAFQGPLTTCAMPLASESTDGAAGSSSKDMRSEDASFASAVTVAYFEGLDELIVFFWPCSGLTLRGGAACARVWHKGGAMIVSMLWHICFCQLIENLLEVKFVVERSRPIDVRHRVVLYDAALRERDPWRPKHRRAPRAVSALCGPHCGFERREDMQQSSSHVLCLVCVFVASGGADVCLEKRGLGGMIRRGKASANESTQDRTALVLPTSIK